MPITYSKPEKILSLFFEQCGATKIVWNTKGFGVFHLIEQRGAVELEGTILKVYLYYAVRTMEVFSGCLADPDSLDKLRTILTDRKQEIIRESGLTGLSYPVMRP